MLQHEILMAMTPNTIAINFFVCVVCVYVFLSAGALIFFNTDMLLSYTT